MSKHLAELCTLLVDGTYGELTSRIVSPLLIHGRLTFPHLSNLSDLSPRYVKCGLAVLVQQRLVHYFTSEDGLTVYEANTRNIYETIRSGRAVQLVAERFGSHAAEVISILQEHGFVEASEILRFQFDSSAPKGSARPLSLSNGNMVIDGKLGLDEDNDHDGNSSDNGTDHLHESATFEQRLEVCRELFASKHVVRLSKDDFLSPSDFHEKAETKVLNEEYGGNVKGTKQLEEFNKSVLKRKSQWLDSNTATPKMLENAIKALKDVQPTRNGLHPGGSAGLAADEVNEENNERSNKKRKTDNQKSHKLNTLDNGKEHFGRSQPDPTSKQVAFPADLPTFCVNREKFHVSFRSQCLVTLSARLLGDITSKVYNALLRRLEHNIPRCHDEYAEHKKARAINDEEGDEVGYDSDPGHEITATSMDVEKDLDASVDVQAMFATDKSAKIKVEAKENGYATADGDDLRLNVNGSGSHIGMNQAMINRQKRVGFVEQHLRLLAEHGFKFLTRVSSRGQGTWSVDFNLVSHALIQLEIENLISSRYGPTAVRIVRILHSKGKLDEKQLGSIGLIRQKDLRRVLTLMQEAGFVDTQEVPRDNTRQPSRTIYLWFYDQDRCRKLVLNDTYKAMSRLIQRAKVEKEKVQTVIDKAERTDVKGQEDKYLSKAEKHALADWQEREGKLLVQLSRQDELVAIFRDFLPQE